MSSSVRARVMLAVVAGSVAAAGLLGATDALLLAGHTVLDGELSSTAL